MSSVDQIPGSVEDEHRAGLHPTGGRAYCSLCINERARQALIKENAALKAEVERLRGLSPVSCGWVSVEWKKRAKEATPPHGAVERVHLIEADPAREAVVRAATTPASKCKQGSFCVECGPGVAVDEDGCCTGCGNSATGPWADRAAAVWRAIARLKGK